MPKKTTPKNPAVTAGTITTLAVVDAVVKPKPTREEILTAMATLKREAIVKEETAKLEAKRNLGKQINDGIEAIVLADPDLLSRQRSAHYSVYTTGITHIYVQFDIQPDELPAKLKAQIERHDKMHALADWQIPRVADIKKQLRAALTKQDQRIPALLADADARAALQAALDQLDKAA